jgi:solute carrier family 25 2-oxodicarboxylate transporter 21
MATTKPLTQSRMATLPPIIGASFTCAATMYPVDVLKALRMGATGGEPMGVLISQFHARYGTIGFFNQGVAPEVLRSGLMRVLKFFFFPMTHELMWGKPVSQGTPLEKAAAGALCTLPESLTIMPLELAKVGLQLDKTNRYKSSSAAVLAEMRSVHGLRGWWVGWVGVQWRQSSWTATYFATLSGFEDLTRRALGEERAGSMPQLVQLVSGFAAGFLGACFNVPGDLIRTDVQRRALLGVAAAAEKPPPPLQLPFIAVGEVVSTASSIVSRAGVSGLWTGLTWKALHLGGSGALMAALLPFFRDLMAVSRE